MDLEVTDLGGWTLLGSGNGRKLERFGDVVIERPSPQAIWPESANTPWRDAAARFRRRGYYPLKSPMQFCLHIHSDHVDASFFGDTSRWHVTFGDSDMDRTV